ncbi:TatD family hydrolase, partial [Patescibacteria group bacterium]|nr:TatD family hydrolase [Patescibacteria group bacterium]
MLIDTHAHLNFSAYKRNLEEVIKRVVDENVWIINVGSKYETSKKALEIALRYKEGFYAAVGLHPIHAAPGLVKIKTDPDEGDFITSGEDFDMGKYKELALSEKVVAIGEIGLDYYYRPKTKKKIEELKNKQKEVFKKQLGIAKELNLPVIFHCRMAHQDLTDILKENKGIKGVVHCFTGTLKEAEKYMEMGFYIGLNGIIFKLDLGE